MTTDTPPENPRRGGSLLFALSIVVLVGASFFAGAMVWPAVQRWRGVAASGPSEGQTALVLEHAAVDLKLGRGAAVVEQLGVHAQKAADPVVKERLLGLWAEAAVQAGKLGAAEAAERQREALASDPAAKRQIQLRRVALLGALKRAPEAAELAAAIEKDDPALADEAQLRLFAGSKTEDELRAWVKAVKPEDRAAARTAGLAALRLLKDAGEAERLLAPQVAGGAPDPALLAALVDAYTALGRPKDVAQTAATLRPLLKDGRAQAEIALVRAKALAQAGDVPAALVALDELLAAISAPEGRQAVRRLRYELLKQAGKLPEEIAALEKRGDRAARAYVALEVERDYPLAVRLYTDLSRESPEAGFGPALAEAQRRRELAERQALYAQVLQKDGGDRGAFEKYLGASAALRDDEAVRKAIGPLLKGHEQEPAVLLDVARMLAGAGLLEDAAGLTQRAYAAEKDAAKKQQILLAMGELFAGAQQDERARRLYSDLAAGGLNAEIRARAMARLAALMKTR
ncbi:MAG TPA: hypothetical protein VGQ83_19595 [Polyangia bacterium]|jgi:hypothetical protein